VLAKPRRARVLPCAPALYTPSVPREGGPPAFQTSVGRQLDRPAGNSTGGTGPLRPASAETSSPACRGAAETCGETVACGASRGTACGAGSSGWVSAASGTGGGAHQDCRRDRDPSRQSFSSATGSDVAATVTDLAGGVTDSDQDVKD
jgi:hypothetical protein